MNMSLCIGLTLSPTWLNGEGWRRADSKAEQLFSSQYYLELAQRAEAAKLDFVFKPDSLFFNKEMADKSPGHTCLDPIVMLASIARETEKIGLVATMSTTFSEPFTVARQLQSLNWMSEGRVGWNIVTSIEGSGNFGKGEMPSSKERYERALEFTEVVRKLWASYPNEALTINRESGQFADQEMIFPIHHKGEFYHVEGPLNVPAFDSTSIPLFQAGASDLGRNFASFVADACFAATPDLESAIELRRDLHTRAHKHGRDSRAIRVLPGMHFFLGETREEAQQLYQDAYAHLTNEQRLAAVQRILGVDLSHLSLQSRITAKDIPEVMENVRSRTHADLLRRIIINEEPTLQTLLSKPEVIGSAHWVVIGTPADAVEEIIRWYRHGALDGVIALPGGSVQSLNLFLEKVVPLLVEKGLFRKEYSGNTLSEHLHEKVKK
ncbi:NtaA/DmoA family FMN-dependent monooxygenase [Robertmurraya siralis]|uniref:NtaA/DmoA family FMN-dependent monooxygenase n=1 Tax=Robertmurraya siralis TaxID=77777 RepID=UPI0010F51DC3|nr:NtaA/DmoA family FMN-dependent monooxygenase [Robertmurraya siralis]